VKHRLRRDADLTPFEIGPDGMPVNLPEFKPPKFRWRTVPRNMVCDAGKPRRKGDVIFARGHLGPLIREAMKK
jgi:hypothetical protein